MSEDTNRTIIVATPAEHQLVYRVDRSKGMQTPFLEIELTPRGTEQARQLGLFLKAKYEIDRIMYTPAEECQYTANIVAESTPGINPTARPELITRSKVDERLYERIKNAELMRKGSRPPLRPIRGGIPEKNALEGMLDKLKKEDDPASYLIIVTPDIYHTIGHYFVENPPLPRQACSLQIHTLTEGITGKKEHRTPTYNFAIMTVMPSREQRDPKPHEY